MGDLQEDSDADCFGEDDDPARFQGNEDDQNYLDQQLPGGGGVRPKDVLSTLDKLSSIFFTFLRIGDLIDRKKIDSNRIYTTTQAARFLGTDRSEVVRLIRDGKLAARMLNQNYMILGRSIVSCLSHKTND